MAINLESFWKHLNLYCQLTFSAPFHMLGNRRLQLAAIILVSKDVFSVPSVNLANALVYVLVYYNNATMLIIE